MIKKSKDPFEVYQSPKLCAKGDLAKAMRITLGKTQLDVAHEAGLSERTIRNLEKGMPVRHESLELVALCLGVEAYEIAVEPKMAIQSHLAKKRLQKLLDSMNRITSLQDDYPLRELLRNSTNVDYLGPQELPWSGKRKGTHGMRDVIHISMDTLDYVNAPEYTNVFHSGNLFVVQGINKVRFTNSQKTVIGRLQHLIEFEGHQLKGYQASLDAQVFAEGYRCD